MYELLNNLDAWFEYSDTWLEIKMVMFLVFFVIMLYVLLREGSSKEW